MTDPLITTIKALPAVASINEWNGRYYINLACARGSKWNCDRNSKLWLKGDALTFERAKGTQSDEHIAAVSAITAAVQGVGGSVREV